MTVPPKCCKNGDPKYEVTYDCVGGEQVLIFCDKHYHSHSIFQKNIKEIKELWLGHVRLKVVAIPILELLAKISFSNIIVNI